MPTPYSLVTVVSADGERPAARREDGVTVALPDAVAGHDDLMALLRDWAQAAAVLESFDPSTAAVLADVDLIEPLRFPNKVLCSGPNYTDHLAEMGENDLGPDWSPYFFFKPPSTAIIGDGADVWIPQDPEAKADWEGELAVVLGRGGRDILASEAHDHVAGYTVANDISLRGPHHRPDAPAPFVWDWIASKAADRSLPMGPGIVPSWLVKDPQQLRITTLVNGQTMQDGNTSNMVFGVDELIAAASRLVTLEPGDVIATGTPAGVGAGRGTFLAPGDTVQVSIQGVGTLTNPIVARPK